MCLPESHRLTLTLPSGFISLGLHHQCMILWFLFYHQLPINGSQQWTVLDLFTDETCQAHGWCKRTVGRFSHSPRVHAMYFVSERQRNENVDLSKMQTKTENLNCKINHYGRSIKMVLWFLLYQYHSGPWKVSHSLSPIHPHTALHSYLGSSSISSVISYPSTTIKTPFSESSFILRFFLYFTHVPLYFNLSSVLVRNGSKDTKTMPHFMFPLAYSHL